MKFRRLVHLHLVDLMQYAENKIILAHALVTMVTLAIPMRDVAQNVFPILIAQGIGHVLETNVKILVRAFAELMLTVVH